MKEELQNKIDKYLMHQMTDEERMAFEKEVNGNEEFEEQLSFTEEVQQVLKSRNDKLTKIRKWEKEDKRYSREDLFWFSGMAAVLVVGFFTVYMYLIPNTNYTIANNHPIEYQLIDKLLVKSDYVKALDEIEKEEHEILMQDRGGTIHITEIDGTIIVDSLVPDAAEDYEDLDLETALESADTSEINLDNGNNSSETIYILDYVINPNNREKVEHLYLMKAKALIGLNRIREALSLLDKLRSSDNKYKTQADSIYKSLNR